jgi:hypothetical protein
LLALAVVCGGCAIADSEAPDGALVVATATTTVRVHY